MNLVTHMIPTAVGALAVRTEGEGQPTLLWHSLFVDDRSWDAFAAPLTPHRRLIRITGPDHGASESTLLRFTNEDCATAAADVLDALGITEPVDWVGNAWGGHVGVLVAAWQAERVRSLVLLGTPVGALTPAERRRTGLLVALYRWLGPARFIVSGASETLLSPGTRREQPEAVSYVEQSLRTAHRAALINAIRSVSLGRTDLTAELPRITAPTLVVTSSDHPGFTPAQAEAAARLLPKGELALVNGTAYLTPLEAPDATREVVAAFWSRIAASTV